MEGLRSKRVVDVACGEQHTACVDSEGRVHTWGFGGSFFRGAGGLGHGDKKTKLYPTLVEELAEEGRRVVQISCGSAHTVALDSEGFVWTWGKGEYGRLGIGSSSDATGPELVELLCDIEPVVQVAAAGSFTLALTASGHVYGWGKNDRARRPPRGAPSTLRPRPPRVAAGPPLVAAPPQSRSWAWAATLSTCFPWRPFRGRSRRWPRTATAWCTSPPASRTLPAAPSPAAPSTGAPACGTSRTSSPSSRRSASSASLAAAASQWP